MRVAAAYLREHDTGDTVHYDGAECDGWCLADDLDAARELMVPPAENAFDVWWSAEFGERMKGSKYIGKRAWLAAVAQESLR